MNLIDISPLTENQVKAFRAFGSGGSLFLTGSAGTGKTLLACYFGIREVLAGQAEKLVIVRSIVSSRDIGFLPGTLQEKMQVYEAPYRDIFAQLFNQPGAYDHFKKQGKVEFITTSFVRGTNLRNAFVFLDECQNMTDGELKSVLTRIGKNSQILIAGDSNQNDLLNSKKETSGMATMVAIAKKMDCFDVIDFTIADIVRSGFVKEYLIARSNLNLD